MTTLDRARDADSARAVIALVRSELPGATHHCWAFVAGAPGSTRAIGMSDAGEPPGTAGRPMLNVLLGGGVGEVVAVCARWFGGAKLGRGGLARAYASGVKKALEGLQTEVLVARELVGLIVPYAAVDPLRRVLDDLDARTVPGGVRLGRELGAVGAFRRPGGVGRSGRTDHGRGGECPEVGRGLNLPSSLPERVW